MNSPDNIHPVSHTRSGPPLGVTLWILFFCYATVTALLAQKLLLPLLPSLHAGSGLMQNDAALFHTYAISMAEAIKTQDWSVWAIHGQDQGYTGNVAILAALYALFGIDPSLMVPITAAAHATGGVLIYLLGRNLWHGTVGKYGGMIAAILFVGFPSALSWYGQPLKDGFSIAGALLILHCWLLALGRPSTPRTAILLALGVATGMALLFFVKPYLLILAFVAALLMLLIMLLLQIAPGTRRSWRLLLCFLPALLLLAGGAQMGANSAGALLDGPPQIPPSPEMQQSKDEFRWVNSDWIPDTLERYIATTARHRAGFIELGREVKAGSMIDVEVKPDSAAQVAAYLPRALQIALFAPFPSTWLDKISVMRLAGIAETLAWYFIIPGIIFALRRSRGGSGRSLKMALLIVYALFFLTVLGFANPNVGTLYRMRYAYLFLLLLIGTLGWTHWFLERRARSQPQSPPQQPEQPPVYSEVGSQALANAVDTSESNIAVNMADTAYAPQTRAGVATAGLLVIVLTLVSSLGFFLRDLLMARQFGFGDELDAFFIAMMIPMFLVTVFSIPLGTAIIPAFLREREHLSAAAAQALVSRVSLLAVLSLSALAILLYLLTPLLLPYLALGFSAPKLERALTLTYWALPLMVASGSVIIGNALLNSMQSFALPSWAQAVVPVAAISALLIFGNNWGATAVVAGMLLGQMLNLAIVALALNRHGLSLRLRWTANLPQRETLRSFTSQYLPLVAAALFIALAQPVGNVLASSLASGSIGALNLGNKIVLFVTGLVGTAIATAILPHFSAYLARNRRLEVRRELSFFLLTGTALAIPVSIACFVAARPLALLAFGGGAVNEADIETVARVIKFGIIQLPVFTCNILLLRFAAASHQSGRVMLLSLVGLALNIGLSLLLMGHMGVAGISLAATLALGVSAFLMLVTLHRLGDVPWVEVVMIALCWTLFFTLMLCLHYRSHAGSVVAGMGIVLLLFGYWREAVGRSRLLSGLRL